MEKIYLQNNNGEWNQYEFETIDDLRKIIAKIGSGAVIGSYAVIGNYAEIGSYAKIGRGAVIGSYAKIGSGAEIGSYAEIGSDYKIEFGNSLYIIGSKHYVVNYINDKIQIGCHTYNFDYWLKNYDRIGKIEGYSPEQIKEYKSYIDFIIKKYEK